MADAVCPFCGNDPYHYVDNGVGMERVAVNCCDLGHALFTQDPAEDVTVTISLGEFNKIADILGALRMLGMDPDIYA